MSLKQFELSNPDSCLNKAANDEPLFVLRANDPVAPLAVRMWAIMYRYAKEAAGEWDERRQNKYREAQMLAIHMERWKQEQERGGKG